MCKYLFLIKNATFILYAIDKMQSAKTDTRRVPEIALIGLGCLGGLPAAYTTPRVGLQFVISFSGSYALISIKKLML